MIGHHVPAYIPLLSTCISNEGKVNFHLVLLTSPVFSAIKHILLQNILSQ